MRTDIDSMWRGFRRVAAAVAGAFLAFGAPSAAMNLSPGGTIPSVNAASGPAVPLADGGKAQAVIVLGEAAGQGAKFAAAELQKDLQALSGAEFQIVTEGPSAVTHQALILIGGPEQNHLVKRALGSGSSPFSNLKADGFVLKTSRLDKRPVVIAGGNDDAATMYAVFELLERLGVTFRMTGDVLPAQQSSLVIPALNLREEPAIAQRGFLVEASHHPSITMLSGEDYQRLFDQMAKMKYNYLQFWWFAYQPWLKFSYHGESNLIGDLSSKESGYLNTMYEGFGSRTTDDVVIGKQWFPGRRMAPPELQNVETPDEAFTAAQGLLRGMIHYAKSRHVKIWLVDEMASLPPNLARYTQRIGNLPFEGIFGAYVDPLDPAEREVQVSRLKALTDTYPEAEGYYLNFPEVYYRLDSSKDLDFFAQPQQQALFQELRSSMIPWDTRWVNSREQMVNSSLGYFDLFKYLLAKRDEVAPKAKLGLMTVGRGYLLPPFDKLLPKDVPFATFDTGGPCGYGTPAGMPMSYFGGMGQRMTIDSPYLDDDCDILGMQFNVWVYTEKDRIYTDGVKNGLKGVAPWMVQPRGTEANSTFLAWADWNPQLTREGFYKDYSERLYGPGGAPDMYRAYLTLEANKAYLTQGQVEDYPTTMGCCGPLGEVNTAYQYSLQDNPFDGPTIPAWKQVIATAPVEITTFEHSISLLNDALARMHAAEPKVAPQGKHELAYLISRTEAYRDDMRAQIAERQGFLAFDRAFRERNSVDQAQFVRNLEASLQQFSAACDQARVATTEYARIIDYPSDFEALYHLNVGTVLGFDLVHQWMKTIVDFHEGKPYAQHVPFEKIFTQAVHTAKYKF
ncbi:MAG TPA: alpha-glucuronidase family glycosyl hydrolase [Terriglobia bacterium]|nr:alpha-glucuronidase family glycosyl hydrolase [Terriglobia bacterium]